MEHNVGFAVCFDYGLVKKQNSTFKERQLYAQPLCQTVIKCNLSFLGTYPPPKACASLVAYKENLLLFGGWTHTSPYPLHQVSAS